MVRRRPRPDLAYAPACSSLRPFRRADLGANQAAASRKLLSARREPGCERRAARCDLVCRAAAPLAAPAEPPPWRRRSVRSVATARFRFLCADAVLVAGLLRHRRRGEVAGSMRGRLRRRASSSTVSGPTTRTRRPAAIAAERRLHPGRRRCAMTHGVYPTRGPRALRIPQARNLHRPRAPQNYFARGQICARRSSHPENCRRRSERLATSPRRDREAFIAANANLTSRQHGGDLRARRTRRRALLPREDLAPSPAARRSRATPAMPARSRSRRCVDDATASSMNYRHGFHAGNFADVFKHAFLTRVARLSDARRRAAALHRHPRRRRALRSRRATPARRSPEWRDGIARLLKAKPAGRGRRAARALSRRARPVRRSRGRPLSYPGSPALAQALLRADDRIALCEAHPEERERLIAALGRDARLRIVGTDGYVALNAYVPPKERRGLVLIDPPYERPDEARRSRPRWRER